MLRDLRIYDPRIPINIGTSSDPYPPEEEIYKLTRKALEILIPLGRKVLITTKGIIYSIRDLDLISRGNVAVTPTITMLDPEYSRIIEPGAPLPSERIKAVERAVEKDIPIGVRIDPIIPFINDDADEIFRLVEKVAEAGARFIVTSTYKARPDNLARLVSVLEDEIGSRIKKLYYENGIRIRGYYYLRKELRKRLLKPVIEAAKKAGLEYATCREGFSGREWFTAKSCDGTHLIPERVKPNEGLRGWMLG